MRWISPAPSPEIVTATEIEAMEYVMGRMRSAKLPGLEKAETLFAEVKRKG
jgi:hypothetical protein